MRTSAEIYTLLDTFRGKYRFRYLLKLAGFRRSIFIGLGNTAVCLFNSSKLDGGEAGGSWEGLSYSVKFVSSLLIHLFIQNWARPS